MTKYQGYVKVMGHPCHETIMANDITHAKEKMRAKYPTGSHITIHHPTEMVYNYG